MRLCFLSLLLAVTLQVNAQLVEDATAQVISEVEQHLFIDNPAGLFSGVEPCTLYFDSSKGGAIVNDTGRQTSAQWIRVAFRKLASAS